MSIGSIGEINVKVRADVTGFNAAMNRVGGKVAATAKKIRASSQVYQSWATVGAAAATAVATAMVKSSLTQLDVLAKTSDALKIQQKNLQALQHQASLTGTSAQQLATNLERMQRRIGEVARKGGAAGEALEEIGINAKEMVNLSADEQVVKIANAMGGMENASLRASIAMDLFGRDGIRMMKMLEQLKGEGLQGTITELENLGVALDRVDTAKVEQANDAMFKSQQVLEGIVNKVAVRISPTLEAMSNQFLNSARSSKGFEESVDSAFKNGLKVIGVFADGLHGVSIIFKGLKVAAFTIAKVVNEAFRIMAKGTEGFVNLGIAAINKLISAANLIPGVALPAMEAFTSNAASMMAEFSEQAGKNLTGSINEFSEALMQPLPSQALDDFVKKAEEASTKIAEAAVGGDKESGSVFGLTDDEKAALEEKIQIIKDSLKTEQQLKNEAFQAEILAIREFGLLSEEAKAEADALELERVQKHADDMLAISKKSAEAEKRIEDAKNQAKMNAVKSTFSNLASLMNTSSKKLFAIGKAAAIAGAIVDGYAAVQKTMSTIPYPFNIPLAAAQAVASAAQVKGISKTKIGGASGGTSSFVGGVPAVNTSSAGASGGGGGQSVQQIDIAGFDSNKFYSGDQLGNLFAAINSGQSQGYRIAVNGGG
jgi:hypothetical protein